MRKATKRVSAQSLSLAALVAGWIAIASAQPVREPLPLDVVTSLRAHNSRSPVNLSPGGEWLAHTYGREETVPRHTAMFAKSGFPFAEGNARTQAALTNTKNGQVIRLGGAKGVSWAPVWSPDGQHVAFYADDSGAASLWIWERSSGKWSSDGTAVYALGADGKLWQVDARSGEGRVGGGLPGHQLRMLVSRTGKTTIWSPDGGRTVWAQGRNADSQEWNGASMRSMGRRAPHPQHGRGHESISVIQCGRE